MKKWPKNVLAVFAAFLIGGSPCVLAANEGADVRILNAKKIFNEITSSDQPIPKEILADANVIVIFPSLVKGGFLYAGRFGLGVVMVRDEETRRWSAPAFVRVSGGSFGFQAGAQFTELILVGKSKYKFDNFKGGPAVSAAMSATAGWWGLHSETGTGWEAANNMHWYSRNQGLFGSLSLDGTVLSYDQGATSAYYGEGVIAQDVLFGGEVRPSPTGQMLIDDVDKYEGSRLKDRFAKFAQMIPDASKNMPKNLPKITFSEPTEAQQEKARHIKVPGWMPRWGSSKK